MSRALIAALCALLLVTGCTTYPRDNAGNTSANGTSFSSVEQWLNLQESVAAMTTEEVVAKLVRVNRPEGVGQLYYYGLLNQRLETYGAWVQARDTFQEVLGHDELSEAQRQLVSLLAEYNQSRINSYLRQKELLKQHTDLRRELATSEEVRLELEQKIQALTELEAVISTRKEQ